MSDKEEFGFPKKWSKIIDSLPEFKDTADASNPEELKKIIISSEGNISLIEKEKEADVKLNAAKEIAKDISGGYRDASKAQMAKIKYALYLLESKGIEVGDKEDSQ